MVKTRSLQLPVFSLPSTILSNVPPKNELIKVVRITAQIIQYNRAASLILFTDQEEEALLLQSALLPGQEHLAKNIRAESFARGFFEALIRFNG